MILRLHNEFEYNYLGLPYEVSYITLIDNYKNNNAIGSSRIYNNDMNTTILINSTDFGKFHGLKSIGYTNSDFTCNQMIIEKDPASATNTNIFVANINIEPNPENYDKMFWYGFKGDAINSSGNTFYTYELLPGYEYFWNVFFEDNLYSGVIWPYYLFEIYVDVTIPSTIFKNEAVLINADLFSWINTSSTIPANCTSILCLRKTPETGCEPAYLINNEPQLEAKIYPNPFNNYFILDFSELIKNEESNQTYLVIIESVQTKFVETKKVHTSILEIPTTHFPKGLLRVTILTNEREILYQGNILKQ